MFVSHDTSSKKKFQKPNILKRKNNFSIKNTYLDCDSSSNSLVSSTYLQPPNIELVKSKACNKYKSSKTLPKIKINGGLLNCEDILENTEGDTLSNKEITNERNYPQTEIINSFFLQDTVTQNVPVIEKIILTKGIQNQQDKPKWMEFINTSKIKMCNSEDGHVRQQTEMVTTKISTSSISILNIGNDSEVQSSNVNQTILTENKDTVIFQCNINDCNKEFTSEQKLRKHRSLHNKDGTMRQPRQSTMECPVKKPCSNGLEEPCGLIFDVREDLVKHLNEEHTLDEAAFKCEECGRHFYWASGLRAHVRSHAARRRALLACAWPGCGRVFHQPCRLREHTRAHTGDKPYPCRHPNCGWSFRTASKLLRHARRHTGERRHACAVCGRAFLRREHLREHAARHHEPHPRRAHACTVADCQQSFTNMSSLYMHMKKVHKKEENSIICTTTEDSSKHLAKADNQNMFMISLFDGGNVLLEEPAKVELHDGEMGAVLAEVEEVDAGEGHAARTHLTWPLARAHDAYATADDVQVEQPEGADSNIYTIRSDLFLHGNIIHNEDSEQMDSAVPLDGDLVLDAPSVDLAQEELYTDVADESSFRVFFLSNEELT